MSEPSDPENIALEFVQLWAENMTKVMAQIASAPFPVEIASTGRAMRSRQRRRPIHI